LEIYISQGSVSTQLRCGGICSNHFITNFPQNVPLKNFFKSVNIWQLYRQICALLFGLPSTCNSLRESWTNTESAVRLD